MKRVGILTTAIFFILVPTGAVQAEILVSEIMYDLETGSDGGREWFEVLNKGPEEVRLADLKFFENNTNHGLVYVSGNEVLKSGEYAVVADNPQKFLTDWGSYSGNLFDSSFSFNNTGEEVSLKKDQVVLTTVSYTSEQGANGDGNSLQLVGGQWRALAPTPGATGGDGSSGGLSNDQVGQQVVNSGAKEGQQSVSEPGNQSAGRSIPVEPQVFAELKAERMVLAGIDVGLSGEAFGLEKKPLSDARYLWSFGDGGSIEGKYVSHSWIQPGGYVVVLEVSSGGFSATARQNIEVVPASIYIGSVSSGPEGFVRLENRSVNELNISFWRLKSGDREFAIPKNTFIRGSAKLDLYAKITNVEPVGGEVWLLYPNGTTASYWKGTVAQEPTTRVENKIEAGRTTPVASFSGETEKKPVAEKTASVLAEDSNVIKVTAQSNSVSESADFSQENLALVTTSKFSNRWILLTILIVGVGLVSIFLARPGKDKSLADQFEIIEEK